MTTDREMLEAAAKACGVGDIDLAGRPVVLVIRDSGISQACWNPLASSADCAAMCAKLMIDTLWTDDCVVCGDDSRTYESEIQLDDNPEATWRYAATMVAAKIGEMK